MQPLRCALVVQPLIIAPGNAKRGTGNLGTRTSVQIVECSTAQKTWTESATVLDVQTAKTHGVLYEVCSHRIEHGRLCCYSLMRQTDSIVPCSVSKSMNLHSDASLQWFPEQHCSSVLPLQGCVPSGVSIVGVYAPALAPVFLVLQALLLGDGAISAQAITCYFPSTLA